MTTSPARDGETFDVGSLRFRTLDTPGHTPEHVSYAVADTARADEPFLLLTGGSLLVGAVGRTDLLGADNARPYAAAMYRSLHDVLLPHEDSVMVYPTHGAGSLCSTGIASTSWSTIGFERRHDPLLAPMEIEAFARALLAGQPTFPRYFARMRPINQAGPRAPRRGRPGDRAVGRRRARRGARGRGRSSSTPARRDAHARGARPGLAVDPGRVVVRDVARLAGRRRPAGRPARRATPPISTTWPARRCASGTRRSSATSTAASRRGVVPGARSRPGAASTSTSWPAQLAARRRRRRRSSSTSARRPNTRPATSRAPSTSAPASCRRRLDALPRDRPIATICASGYRSSVAASLLRAAGSSVSPPSSAASRTGRRMATRSTTAPAPTASTGRPRRDATPHAHRRRGHAH